VFGGAVLLTPVSALGRDTIASSRVTGGDAADGSPCARLSEGEILWMVPSGPGGGYDAYSRLIAPAFSARTGAAVRVENFPGGGGVLAARKISEAVPDGRTIGMVNGAGLLIAALTGVANTPNLMKDFCFLGLVARERHVWVTGKNSKIKTMADVFTLNRKRAILFGATEVGGSGFADVAIVSNLLGIEAEYVVGYSSSRQYVLAAIRGDIDIVALSLGSALSLLENGELRPLLQVSADRLSGHPSLENLPLLGGESGLAARRAGAAGRDVGAVVSCVDALTGLLAAGRLVVAPAGLDAGLRRCLQDRLYEAMTILRFQRRQARRNDRWISPRVRRPARGSPPFWIEPNSWPLFTGRKWKGFGAENVWRCEPVIARKPMTVIG
jgi:tripartite-type tricarboxylate transporter receptor subunit TctC